MFLLTESQVDWIVRFRRPIFLGGLALMAQPFVLPQGWSVGVLSGFMLFSLGIYGFAFRNWRTEPGLWMLAALLAVTWGPCWAYCEIVHLRALFERAAAVQDGQAIDGNRFRFALEVIIGFSLWATSIKLAITVAIKNWQRTKSTQQSPKEVR